MSTFRFDIAEHLETEEDIRGFLSEVAATGDEADFIHALGIAARAKGMSEITREAGRDQSKPVQISCRWRESPF